MYIFLFFIILTLILSILYLIIKLHKFSFIKKIPNKIISWLVCFIPIIILFLFFNYVNTFVIIIHLIIFFWLSEFFSKIIQKIRKKDFTFYFAGTLAILFTTFYLGIGAYLDYHVFETHYEITTNKDLGKEKLRIIQISDSHIGATFDGNGFKKHIERISKIDSDLVVITGDFVDDDTTYEDMVISCEAFKLLKPTYGIYFIYGNHDRGYFDYRNFKEKELVEKLEQNNVQVLNDDVENINDYVYLIGRDDKSNKKRKSINELVQSIDADKYIIDLNHQPNDYQNEMNKVDLVLSGHTHGGQLFPLGYFGVLTGENDEFYGLHTRGKTNFIVNSGISDWAIDFKTGTFSEFGVIDIINVK